MLIYSLPFESLKNANEYCIWVTQSWHILPEITRMYSQSSSLMDYIFANLSTRWNLFVTPKSMLMELSQTCRERWKVWAAWHAVSPWVWPRLYSAVLSQLNTVNKCPFHRLFSVMFFTSCAFCWWCWYFIWPWHSANMLPSVPKCKKIVMCLTEIIHILDWLLPGMSSSGLGCEFNVNQSNMVHPAQKRGNSLICTEGTSSKF